MNEIKIPSIEFVRLKKGITEEELNDYMEENGDGSFFVYLRYKYDFEEEWTYSIECAFYDYCRFTVRWLNDWYEGKQNVEYLAISKLGEELGWPNEKTCTNESEYDSMDEFKCSNCGFTLVEHKEYAVGEDDGEEYYFNYKPKYCPNCGRKIVD